MAECRRTIDRVPEGLRLHEAIRKRASVLICGPAGIGKTTLISEVLAELPAAAAQSVISVSGPDGLQPLLRALLQKLHSAGDPILRQRLRAEGVSSADFKNWLKKQSTSKLKGAVYGSVQTAAYWVFLDHVPALTSAVAKVVRELIWMRNTPVYLAARYPSPEEAGHAANIYWSERHRLILEPLHAPAARELLDQCIYRFGLARLDLDDFREAVLSLSGNNPGALVTMCKLAAEPRYHHGLRIKTRMIYIDYLMSLRGRNMEPEKSERPE